MKIPRFFVPSLRLVQIDWRQAWRQGRWLLWVSVLLWIAMSTPALAVNDANLAQGVQIFNTHCAGCHPRGGNIIRRGKTLKMRALKRQQLETVAAIADLVENGKNNMSGFQEHLSTQQIADVSTYVLEQAQHNWR